MSTNELIAEAREVLSRPIRGDHENEQARGVITRLADALEQVAAERDALLSAEELAAEDRGKLIEERDDLRKERVAAREHLKRDFEAEAEWDALTAVVEQVREYVESLSNLPEHPLEAFHRATILDMLSAPHVALDRVKWQALREAAQARREQA